MAFMSAVKALSLILAFLALTLVALALRATSSLGREREQVVMATSEPALPSSSSGTPTAFVPLPFPPTPLPEVSPALIPANLPSAPITPTYIILPSATPPSSPAKAAKRRTARSKPTSPPKSGRADAATPRRILDPHMPTRVSIREAKVEAGRLYWRLISVRWLSPKEAQGRHHIFVEVLDEHGHRLGGQPVQVSWPGGMTLARTDTSKPEGEAVSFPQYGLLGSYSVAVLGLPSDEIQGLGLGLQGNDGWADHTCWYLLFQRSKKAQ